ncbi:MAG: chromosomal replication initiator protein DnaA [Pirellulales bacterium]
MQDVKLDDREVVAAMRRALADRVGAERYDMWFASSARFRVVAGRVVVVVPNAFLQDWLRNNFRSQIEEAAREAVGGEVSVGFEIEEPAAAPTVARRNDVRGIVGQSGVVTGGPAPSVAPAVPAERGPVSVAQVFLGLEKAVLAEGTMPAAAAPSRKPTLPRRLHRFDEFVVGASNRLAYASAVGCTERLGGITPLVLHGPTGVGKSHLLEAIVEAARRAHPQIETALLSAEQFTSSFLEALNGGGLPNFRRKFRNLHLLAIDDLQFLAGKKATLVELVHTLDQLQRDGKQIVFTADRSPAELTFLGPELRNRLFGGLVVGLETPDMQTRFGITGRIAARLGLELPHDVREFVAARFTSHARELSGALKRLLAAARAYERPIDLKLAEQTLADLLQHQQKTVRLADIDKAVRDVFGLETESLQSSRKGKEVSHPRMLAMWLARKYTRAALSEIGRYFGGRSHSTVISAQKKVDVWMSRGEPLPTPSGECRFEEALRRVEKR